MAARVFALAVHLLGACGACAGCSVISAPGANWEEEPQSGCPLSLAQTTDDRLERTSLPKTFAECVEEVGIDPTDPMRCSYGVSEAEYARFDECVRIGGVQVVTHGSQNDHRRCGIEFRCGSRPCIGTLCQ